MERIAVIGSGASGVHFALSVLRKGYEVVMLDVGRAGPPVANPDNTLNELKANLSDPVAYFLGQNYEAVTYPGSTGEYYGFPPNKRYIFKKPSRFKSKAEGFEPLFSFARGGLAEAWTGGVYPLSDGDLREFPFGYGDIAPFFGEVANRIGISGADDDLARFYPVHDNLRQPLRLDPHSARLLAAYEENKTYLNKRLGCYVGRSRVATLGADTNERSGCSYCGRCLWGCPSGAFYTPAATLKQCHSYSNFAYVPNVYVSHFKFDRCGRIASVVTEGFANGSTEEVSASRFVLAAGTLSSSKIFMDSIWRETGEVVKLTGLMDNRQILVPFVNLEMIGTQYQPDSYQYHQIAMGIESGRKGEYVHAQITTLKTAPVHPILQSIPLGLGSSITLFRNVRAGLGLVNVNLHDYRRESNFVTLQTNRSPKRAGLFVKYSPAETERSAIKSAVKAVRKSLWKMNCVVPPGMAHVRPMGASVHYAGTIPMSTKKVPRTVSEYCQSNDFENLYFVDGTTFPSLPSKNITFALMANAVRVAEHAF